MKLGGLRPAARRLVAAVFDNLHMGGLPPPAQEGVHCLQSQPQPEHWGGPQKSPGCRLEGAGGGRAVPHTPPRASSRLSPARCREVAAADVALTAPPAPHRAPRPEQRRGPSAAPFPKHPQGGAQPPAPPEAAPRQDAAWCPGDLARARPDTDIPPLIPQDKIFQARPVTWMPPSALKAEPGLDGGCSGPARTLGRGSGVGANPRG